MPPPNLTAATAIDMGALPFETTTDPDNNSNTLWYKYTASASDLPVIGLHPYSATTYRPRLVVKTGPDPSSLTDYLFGYYADRRPIVVPVDAGTTYYFRIDAASGSSYSSGNTFTLRAYNAPSSPTPSGSLLVTDDSDGFTGGLLLDQATGDPLRYITIAPTEVGDALPTTGHILVWDLVSGTDLKLFTNGMVEVATLPGLASGVFAFKSNRNDLFYVATGATLRTVDTDGNIGATTWTLASSFPHHMAPAQDDSILYYSTTGSNQPVRRFDLVNSTGLSNLAAGVGASYTIRGMHVADDGTILVHYILGTTDQFIRRYNPDGSTAQDYNFGSGVNINRTALSDDDHLWLWIQSAASGTGTFKKMRLSDGVIVAEFTQYHFVNGVSEEAPSATPQEFGHSNSCPLILFFGTSGGDGSDPVLDDSDPCCDVLSTVFNAVKDCLGGPILGAGSTGPMATPATGTWSNTLNATGGGSGGGGGSSWSAPDADTGESWG